MFIESKIFVTSRTVFQKQYVVASIQCFFQSEPSSNAFLHTHTHYTKENKSLEVLGWAKKLMTFILAMKSLSLLLLLRG